MWFPFLNWLVVMMVDQPFLEPKFNVFEHGAGLPGSFTIAARFAIGLAEPIREESGRTPRGYLTPQRDYRLYPAGTAFLAFQCGEQSATLSL